MLGVVGVAVVVGSDGGDRGATEGSDVMVSIGGVFPVNKLIRFE